MTDQAHDTADFFSLTDDSPVRALHRLTDLALQRVPGCSGATATLWEPGDVMAMAATHPDTAVLAERQFSNGDGPIIDALRSGEPSVTPDTLHEQRWPDFARAALASGVRSSTTTVHGYGSNSLTLSLYGVRPRALDRSDLHLASLLATFGAVSMADAAEYVTAQRTAAQLQEAISSRAVVDQAKGILMQLLGCAGDQAFERLRHISQTQHVKLTEVARQVVQTRAEPQ